MKNAVLDRKLAANVGGYSALMERDHMPDRYAEAIDDGLASANPRMAHNMRVLGLDRFGHKYSLK